MRVREGEREGVCERERERERERGRARTRGKERETGKRAQPCLKNMHARSTTIGGKHSLVPLREQQKGEKI